MRLDLYISWVFSKQIRRVYYSVNFLDLTRPLQTASCNQRSLTSMCLMRPKPRLDAYALADDESVETTTTETSTPISRNIICIPKHLVDASMRAQYSASATDKACTGWVDDQVLKQCLPNMIAPPDVDFLDLRHPVCCLQSP